MQHINLNKKRVYDHIVDRLETTTTATTQHNNNKKHKYENTTNLLQDIVTLLTTCSSCHGNLKKPTTLPCGTTLCNDCVSTMKSCPSSTCNRTHDIKKLQPNVIIQSMQSSITSYTTTDQLRHNLNAECPICCNTYTSPTTTPCGHTFCRECLVRSLDYQRFCPFCRDHIDYCPPPTTLLVNLLSQLFDKHHTVDPSVHDLENDHRVPLLISNLAFPHINCSVHIFEPRYRLMLRRIMSSSRRRFAMCLARRRRTENESPFYEYGTMLELMHVQTLADGRSIVEAVGSHRFKVTKSELIDGYHMADIERIDDIDFEQETLLEQQHILTATAARARQQKQRESPAQTRPTPARPLSMSQFSMPRSLPTTGHRQSWAQRAHPQTQSQMKKAPWLQMHVRGLSAARSKPPMIAQQRPQQQQQPVPEREIKNHQIQSTEELLNEIVDFIEKLMHHKHTNAALSTWLNALGESPVLRGPQRDRVALTWWFVNMMPLSEEEKYTLLPICNFRERLLIIISWVDCFQDQWSLFLNQPNSLCTIS